MNKFKQYASKDLDKNKYNGAYSNIVKYETVLEKSSHNTSQEFQNHYCN